MLTANQSKPSDGSQAPLDLRTKDDDPMANLLHLPTELLIHTMADLEPLDLIRFSYVCRRMSEVAGQRSVWERAFRTTCEKAQVFEPSYHPIEGLDIGLLKEGALGPTLLAQTLTAWQGILPAREMVLENGDLFEETSHPIGVHLVPGGRYVIGGNERCIFLWDIGVMGAPSSGVSPLTSVHPDSPHSRYWSISAPTSHLRSYLRFFVSLWNKQQAAGYIIIRKICVYEVGPLPSEICIRLVSTLDVVFMASRLTHNWISGNRVYLQVERRMMIWNFVNSELASLDNIPEKTSFTDSQVLQIGDKVVLLLTHGMYTWDLPCLQPLPPRFAWETWENMNDQNEDVGPIPSYTRFLGDGPNSNNDPDSTSSERSILFGPSKWCRGLNSPVFTISERDDEGCIVNLTQVRLDVLDGHPRATVISKLPPPKPLLVPPQRRQGHYNRRYSICDERVFATMASRGMGIQMVHSSSDTPGSDWDGGSCTLEHGVSTVSCVHSDYLICPVSARYAYVCDDRMSHRDSFKRIHVVELLDL